MKPETIGRIEFIKQHPELTSREMATALNCSIHTVTTMCRDRDLTFRHVNRYGWRPGHDGEIFNVFAEENWLA